MCSSENIGSRRTPKSGIPLPASRRNTRKQATPGDAPASAGTKTVARKGAASAKARKTTGVASPDGQSRAAKPISTTATSTDGRSTHRGAKYEAGGSKGVSEAFLHQMLCIMQGMEADIVSLKTDVASLKICNNQQAKELAKLRAENNRLERDNEAFREEVESTIEAIEDVVTRNFKKGEELDARVKNHTDVVSDEFNGLNLRTDALAETVESVRNMSSTASQGVQQAKLHRSTKVVDKRGSKEHGQMAESFEIPASEWKAPLLPASSLALNKTTGSEPANTRIKTRTDLNVRARDEGSEDEDNTGTATPSPSASSTSGTFLSILDDNASKSDLTDDHHQRGGRGARE